MFGTASMQLTLQDGWMLTNVSANGDNSKLADVMTTVFQAIAGGGSGGATTAAGAATGKAKGGAPGAAPTGQPVDRILAPGLYAFDYSVNQSRVQSVCAVAYFDSNGSSHPTTTKDPGACGPDVSRPQASPYVNQATQSR
ncbi:zinc finger mynd domain-containing protein [Paraburkholderia caribensis MBA4]|uniref:Zinc finger mynd domain-containing protein n=2 Tax=Paraburkholderia caribensis TaxID=75105 RepID=A0A0P0RJ23_9BURK|nr:zinc finger mynd domain-containing protein [Paraburkholderia caribensis MBA4]